MPSWFSKVFKGGAGKTTTSQPAAEKTQESYETPNPILESDDGPTEPEPGQPALRGERTIVEPVLRVNEETQSGPSEDVRIKARIAQDRRNCTFLVDRPLLEGYSAYFPDADAAGDSPLAQALFAIRGVAQVTIHGYTVTVMAGPNIAAPWSDKAKEIGAAIREHIKAGKQVVSPDFLEHLPSEEEIKQKLETVIVTEINPAIAGHSGAIALEAVEGNTVYIQMMGGCQGCAASAITLRQGIFTSFREAVPQIGAILDSTDHSAGKNPYFKQLPAEMQNA